MRHSLAVSWVFAAFAAFVPCAAPSVSFAAGRPLTLADQFQTVRPGDVRVSPDGKWVVFSVTTYERDANSRQIHLWLLATDSGAVRRITTAGHVNEHPTFSPDSRRIAFASDRDGTEQIWTLDLAGGGDPQRLTRLALGAEGPEWSPDGKWVGFVSQVYPACKDEACNKRREEASHDPKAKALGFDHLFARHWTRWRDGKRAHLFAISAVGSGGTPRDLTPGLDQDVPTWRLGDARDYAFSSDGRALLYATKEARGEAWSTNSNLFEVPIAGGAPRKLTTNPADDATPRAQPGGSLFAYRAQARAGYESDRWRLMVQGEKGGPRELTSKLDSWVGDLAWAAGGKVLDFVAEERGHERLWEVSLEGGEPRAISGELSVGDFDTAPGGTVYAVASTTARFPEIYRLRAGAPPEPVTRLNAALAREVELPHAEPIDAMGSDGQAVHGFVLKPAGLRAGKRYPLAVLIHGGPQQAWLDAFGSIRWSPQLYAARGYAVLLANPRGSTGYGQAYVDGVSRDWGGKPYEDILRLTDAAAKLPYVDGRRACALGASFGGFMVNWIQAKSDRFRCLVAHAGLFDQRSMYFTTEELWFPEWEFAGPPWQNGALYDKFSPSQYVEKFRTPELVTHGELDYRVPIGQGLGMFTALQRRGIESQFLYFPDEGHWVGRPQNLERWLETIWRFMDAHVK